MKEESLPDHVSYGRKGENGVLRDLTNFTIFSKEKNKGEVMVKLKTMEDHHLHFFAKGTLVSHEPGMRNIQVKTSQLIQWSFEFTPMKDDSSIWVKTEHAWYRLMIPDVLYEPYFSELGREFFVVSTIYYCLLEYSNISFDKMIALLGDEIKLDDVKMYVKSISNHLGDDPDLGNCRFLSDLEKKKKIWKNGKKSAPKNKRNLRSRSVRKKKKKVDTDESYSDYGDGETEVPEEIKSDDSFLKKEHELDFEDKTVKDKAKYGNLDDLEPGYNIPNQLLNDKGRLVCYLCKKSFPKRKMDELITHFEKHQVNFLGGLSEEELKTLKVSSFLNQLRVRSAIESCMKDETSKNNSETMNGTPSKKRKASHHKDKRLFTKLKKLTSEE